MFLRRDFLDAWIVAASGSTNVDPDQCGDVGVPVPCKRGLTQMSPHLEKALIWGGMTVLAVSLLLIASFLVD
jgi:hypothetical protein